MARHEGPPPYTPQPGRRLEERARSGVRGVLATDDAEVFTFGGEDLDGGEQSIADEHVALGIYDNSLRAGQRTGGVPKLSELRYERAVRGEFDDAPVECVHDVDVAGAVQRDGPRHVEAVATRSPGAGPDGLEDVAIAVEEEDEMVVGVGADDVALRGDGQADGAWRPGVIAQGFEGEGLLEASGEVEDEDLGGERVGDEQAGALRGDGH